MTSRAKFTDRVAVDEMAKMPDEYRDLVNPAPDDPGRLRDRRAPRYGPRWFLNAPTADDMFRLTHIIAEELDHFRGMHRLLNELGVDRSDLLRRSNGERALEAFRVTEVPSWADVAAFCCLVDRVGRYQIEEMVGSSFQPLDGVLPQIMREEIGHVGFGAARLAQLAADPETKASAQAAVDRWYPKALDMFGRSGSWRAERFIEWGLKHRLNEEARNAYIAEVSPVLQGMGLIVPAENFDRHYL